MKKNYLVLAMLIILSIAFFACEKEEPPVDDPDDPVIEETYRYDLSASNVESFYDLSVGIEKMNGRFVVNVSVSQMVTGEVRDATISIIVYVDATFPNERKLTEQNVYLVLTEEENDISIMLDQRIDEASLFYVEVKDATGSIEIEDDIDVVDITYTLPEYIIEEETQTIEIDDPETNQANYEALIKHISDLYLMLDEGADYLQISANTRNTTMTSGYYDESIETFDLKMVNDNSYIEIKENDETTVYQYAYDRYFVYEFDKDQVEINPYILEADDSIDEEIGFTMITLGGYLFDPEVMLFTKTDKGYTVETFLSDTMSEYEFSVLTTSMASIGFTEEEINGFKLTLEYEIDDEYITQTEQLSMIHEGEFNIISHSTVEQTISVESFERIDFNDDKYNITPPDELNEVVEETDFSTPMVEYNHPIHYTYMTYLEPGQYVVNNPEGNLRLNYYDEDGNALYLNDIPYFYTFSPYGLGYLFIEEAGYYYLEITGTRSDTSDGYTFSLDRLDYATILDLDQPETLPIGTYTFESEGEHDFILFDYDVSEPTLLKISPSEASYFCILYKNTKYEFYENLSMESLYVPIDPDEDRIVLYGGSEKTIDLNIEMVDTSHYQDDNLETMTEITETLSEYPVYTSEALGYRYMKLIVEDKAYYTIHYEPLDDMSTPAAHIYDVAGETPNANVIRDDYGVVLEPGTYYFSFYAYSDYPAAGYVRYEKILYEEEIELNLTLEETETLNRFDESFPEGQSIFFFDENQIYRAWFTLDKEEVVIICNDDWKLFTAEGELIGVYYNDLYNPDIYFHLDAGSYYIEQYNQTYGYQWTTSILAAIYVGELEDDYIYGSTVPHLTLNEDVTVVKNNNYDTELFKLELTEQTAFYRTGMATFGIKMYDENGNYIKTIYRYDEWTLDAGTYYFLITDARATNESETFKIEIQ